MTDRAQAHQWWQAGEEQLARALGYLSDGDFVGNSLLPGWSRQRLLAHVARNADALVNLLTWARTGVETPMYASDDAREAGIASASLLSPAELRSEVLAASVRLSDAVSQLPEPAWSAEVRTAQGRTVQASAVLWMRCREVWVHSADLDAGVGFADIPAEVLVALIDDVFAMWTTRGTVPDITVTLADTSDAGDDARAWGAGSVSVSGSASSVAAWVTGRSPGVGISSIAPIPTLPRWL